jgi:cation diffusion facilitator CzcD-associated flavoprotein CzcO
MNEVNKRDLRIAIIGAGPGGLCMAIRLKQAGFDDLVLLEKADGVGGTWYHNRYPGCACDLPSYLYSFSFEIKRDWSRPYAPQPEILAYMEHCAEKYGVLPHCRFGCEVRGARWDEEAAHWSLELPGGEVVEADVVVSAIGMFNEFAWPDIEGIDDFEGTTFHTARWNWEHDLAGETVGVIGSAASAVQAVPEIVKVAKQVHLFQRSANWVMPKVDAPYTAEELETFRTDEDAVPALRRDYYAQVDGGMLFDNPEALALLEEAGRSCIAVVENPELREKLAPEHPFGCKRPLLSNDYYPAFNRPDLELVTDPIERITKRGVLTADGRERELDTLVFASGFSATKFLSAIDVRGRGGRSIDEAWSEGAQAYLGITTAGFPNMFMLYGPNTNNGSILEMIECQVEHVIQHVLRMADEDLAWVDARPEVEARYNEEVQQAMAKVEVWNAGCNGYYRTPSGRIVTQYPFTMSEFKRRTAKPDPADFEVERQGNRR